AGLVEDKVAALGAHLVVGGGHGDGVLGASLDAHTAVDALEHVDFEDFGRFEALGAEILNGGLVADDGDALGGAGGAAHVAGDALDVAAVVHLQVMLAAVADGRDVPLVVFRFGAHVVDGGG